MNIWTQETYSIVKKQGMVFITSKNKMKSRAITIKVFNSKN
jgi:hypothetical protein